MSEFKPTRLDDIIFYSKRFWQQAGRKYCARVMDDWFPARYYWTLKGAHKDRFRYGTSGLTLYECDWKSGQWIKRPWRDDLPSAPVPNPKRAGR